MKKRLIISLLTACMMFQTAPPVINAEDKDFFENSIILLLNSPKCFVDGEMKDVGDAVPIIVNDRTLVPVRFIAESLGGEVSWNGDSATATLECDGNTIDVPIGENKIVINGQERQLDVGAELISDRTMLPLRAIGEALGKAVDYNDGIISLSDNDVEKYDKNSPYSNQVMTSIRKKLSAEKNGKKAVKTTKFTFEEMMANAGSLMFSREDIPYASETDSYAVTGNVYIENLKIDEYNDTEYKVSFDAYNYDYVYAIAEVFDADGNLISHKMINPFGGTWTSIAEYGVAVYNLGVGVSQWVSTGNSAYFTYRNKTQTEHTFIELTVPNDGYVHITGNPMLSQALCIYDVTQIIMQSISTAALSVVPSKDDNLVKVFIEEIEENVSSELKKALIADPSLYSELLLIVSGEIDAINAADSATSMTKKIFTLLGNQGINILDDAQETATKIFAGSSETVLKNLASLFVDNGIGKALDAMSMINTASDYVCFMMDIHFSTSKSSLVLEMCPDELKLYNGDAKFRSRTISGAKNGFILKNNQGETSILHRGDFAYKNYLTNGKKIYYFNKDTLAINCIDIDKHTNVKVSDVFRYFNTYYVNDWSKEDCISCGTIAGYHNGKIYFEECGSFDIFPMATVDIKTGDYTLTPLRNVGKMRFYGDKIYYMIQTGAFMLLPLYIADADGNGNSIFKDNVWKFEVRENMLYYCVGTSDIGDDYDKGTVYRRNLDTGEENVIAENIKPSSEFENIVNTNNAQNK